MKTQAPFRSGSFSSPTVAVAPRLQPESVATLRPRRVAFILAALFALFALPAGAQPEPAFGPPSEPPPGRVLLFPEPNYHGEPLEVPAAADFENLEYVRDSRGLKWNDRIVSVRVEGPVLLLMYEHADFQGATATLTRNAADLNALSLGDRRGGTWTQRISSLRVEPVQPGGPPIVQWNRRDAERAVRSAYRDLLGREPDGRGLHDYRDQLTSRGWTEDQLRDNLRHSSEFRSRDLNAIIRRVYRDVLKRDPDPSGLARYTRTLNDGMSEAEFRADLLRSREYAELHARESVTRAYRELLRRDPDPAGLASYMKNMMERGWDERRIRESLHSSEEYRQLPKK